MKQLKLLSRLSFRLEQRKQLSASVNSNRINPLGFYTPTPIQMDLAIRNLFQNLAYKRNILNSWHSL